MNGVKKLVKKILTSNYNIPNSNIKKLEKNIKYVEALADGKVPFNTKKEILKQKGGIFPLLIPIIGKALAGVGATILAGKL